MVPPDLQQPLLDSLAELIVQGADLELAAADGRCARVRVKLVAGGFVVVAARAHRVQPEASCSVRVRSGATGQRIHVVSFVAEEVEATMTGRVDVLLRVVGVEQLPDRLAYPPADCDQDGGALTTTEVERDIALRPIPIRVIEASDRHIALICDRRLPIGERLDVRFVDGVGGSISCRVGVARVETLVRRRARLACEIVALSEGDARRLGALVRRHALDGQVLRPAS